MDKKGEKSGPIKIVPIVIGAVIMTCCMSIAFVKVYFQILIVLFAHSISRIKKRMISGDFLYLFDLKLIQS